MGELPFKAGFPDDCLDAPAADQRARSIRFDKPAHWFYSYPCCPT